MAVVKLVERDSGGLISKVIETDATDAVALRCAELQKALDRQIENARLVESRLTEVMDSLMRETKEQRETITALRESLRATGAELRTVVGIADRRSRECDHLRRSLRSAEASYDQANAEARALRESQRRRSKVPYWHRIGKLVNT